MKKIIYIIPIILLSILLVNNVYGTTDYTDSYDDAFNHALNVCNNNGWSSVPIYDDLTIDYTNLINSVQFQKALADYPYYFIAPYYYTKDYDDNSVYLRITFFDNPNVYFRYFIYDKGVALHVFADTDTTFNCCYYVDILYENGEFYFDNAVNYVLDEREYISYISEICNQHRYIMYSKNLWSKLIYSNFNLKTSNGSNLFEKEPTVEIICEYNSDYSQATLTANVLNAQGGEKLYYSGDIIFNSGLDSGSSEGQHSGAGSEFGEEADSLFHLYSAPVSFTTNRVVTFKLCDSNDNFICQTSYNITQIQNFNGVSFDVSFDTSNASYLIFTPTLDSLNNAYYSIYCRINADTDDLLVTRNGNRFSDYSDTNYSLLSNNESVALKYTGLFSTNVDIDFEIRNKNNGAVVLTRTYSYKLSKSSSSTLNDIVENGTSTGGGLGSGFSSLNENSSINDIIETSKETFNTFSLIFDLLPGFVWAFLGVALTIIIVLRILGR